MNYIPIIGLEIHVQLKTRSKMFCSCDNAGETKPPNTTVCPICMGHPGVLPVPNKQAIEWAVLAALALNCEISKVSKMDRKNYFYPDLPKAYQISQFDRPIGKNGYLDIGPISPTGPIRHIRITRVHLEEDAAKLTHEIGHPERQRRISQEPEGRPATVASLPQNDKKEGFSFVDFNRSGTPLLEIVTEPDLRSPQEAKIFLQELRLIMRYLRISDADMEKGHLRCDANISLLPASAISSLADSQLSLDSTDLERTNTDNYPSNSLKISEILYPKTEIKNLNSFKAVERALEYEILRQTKLFEQGKPPAKQSTRGWNESKGITEEQRTKEESHDYRYFPEPDIPPLNLLGVLWRSDGVNLASTLPELPAAKRLRFQEEYGFNASEARILTDDIYLADYTEKVMSELYEWLSSLPEE